MMYMKWHSSSTEQYSSTPPPSQIARPKSPSDRLPSCRNAQRAFTASGAEA
jgi:hypothetical protein